ncbi:MAG: hypothetical protein K2X93_11390 [Candidatus Obscuribacterales bacterium]|nr:hypothetical protein [Candidatus Obscuribacterales bacterium]
MFDKLKFLWNRISEKFEGNLARKEEVADFQELERTKQRLEQMRSRTSRISPEATGSVAVDQVRRRVTSDMPRDPNMTSVQRNRQAINKWLHREDYEPASAGSFDTADFNRRLAEAQRASDERDQLPLPAIEHTFMAFSRPQEESYEADPISLSGVHYRVDPLEVGDDIFLPQVSAEAEQEADMDFTPVTSFSPDAESESMGQQAPVKISNPMIQTLATLEERMSRGNRTIEGFWVGGGGD